MRRTAALLLALALAAPASAQTAAADPLVPAVGARVRVSAPGGPLIGTLVRATQDSLVVAPERGGYPLALARADVGSFEVSRGRRSRMRAAAPWAAGGALLFGLSLGVAESNPCTSDMTRVECEDASNRAVARQAAGGAVFGAVLGGTFGALFRRSERWQAATIPVRVALTFPVQNPRRGAGVAVAMRW